MKAICVDDEELILYMIVKMCESLPQLDEVKGFKSATQALDWMKERKNLGNQIPRFFNSDSFNLVLRLLTQCYYNFMSTTISGYRDDISIHCISINFK